jgi:hypothetical protein
MVPKRTVTKWAMRYQLLSLLARDLLNANPALTILFEWVVTLK